MRALLINPFDQTVEEIEYSGNYRDIYKIIDCDIFTIASPNTVCDRRLDVFIDDEGLFKEDQAFFMIAGYPQPLAGRGLLLESDDQGETIGTTESIESAKKNITFGFPVIHHETGDLGFIAA